MGWNCRKKQGSRDQKLIGGIAFGFACDSYIISQKGFSRIRSLPSLESCSLYRNPSRTPSLLPIKNPRPPQRIQTMVYLSRATNLKDIPLLESRHWFHVLRHQRPRTRGHTHMDSEFTTLWNSPCSGMSHYIRLNIEIPCTETDTNLAFNPLLSKISDIWANSWLCWMWRPRCGGSWTWPALGDIQALPQASSSNPMLYSDSYTTTVCGIDWVASDTPSDTGRKKCRGKSGRGELRDIAAVPTMRILWLKVKSYLFRCLHSCFLEQVV